MRFVITAAVFLLGMLDLFMGFNFLFNPLATGAGLGVSPLGTGGLSTIRADFTAFFLVVAVCMMIGAWRRNADLLLVPVGLMGIAVLVRGLGLVLDGPYAGWQMPMAIEALHVIVLIAAWRVLPHHKIKDLTS
ncbi:MAG TPA: hypothetical protein PKN09_04085 [Novosphingobium sp.]|nr:hypothetical protein [Novosphingobium sp.]